MKKVLLTIAIAFLLNINSYGSSALEAKEEINEQMIKLVLKTQNLNDEQAQLALDAILALKEFGEGVEENKGAAQSYLESLVESDSMNVDEMMKNYNEWQEEFNGRLERTLRTVSALHGKLSKEQRKELFSKLQALSD